MQLQFALLHSSLLLSRPRVVQASSIAFMFRYQSTMLRAHLTPKAASWYDSGGWRATSLESAWKIHLTTAFETERNESRERYIAVIVQRRTTTTSSHVRCPIAAVNQKGCDQ